MTYETSAYAALKIVYVVKDREKDKPLQGITLTQPFMPTREFLFLWLLNCNNSATTNIFKINIENKSLNIMQNRTDF
jgi:hypothetical protein